MAALNLAPADVLIEECADQLSTFIETLGHYPESVLAFALRAHLGSLLHVMKQRELCDAEQIENFLFDLKQEILGTGE